MAFSIETRMESCKFGMDGTVFELRGPNQRATIWPAMGFNCLKWEVFVKGRPVDMLWSALDVYQNPAPTRSGIPLLCPFPNRINQGRFSWEGEEYLVPINDPQVKNAIHGFACFAGWEVGGSGLLHHGTPGAWLEATYYLHSSECENASWPGPFCLRVIYKLNESSLSMDVTAYDLCDRPLPFGFGIHPYFRFPAKNSRFGLVVEPNMSVSRWALEECLPTGEMAPDDAKTELMLVDDSRKTSEWAAHDWDDAFHIRKKDQPADGFKCYIESPDHPMRLIMQCSGGFRELVVFTPPHGEAVCLEPYTCATDALNLQPQGIDAGLRMLDRGKYWQSRIEMRAESL